MQEVIVKTYCDYPGCADEWKQNYVEGQDVQEVDFQVSMAKGRKANVILIVLCEKHVEELRGLHRALAKYDQKGEK